MIDLGQGHLKVYKLRLKYHLNLLNFVLNELLSFYIGSFYSFHLSHNGRARYESENQDWCISSISVESIYFGDLD